MGTSAAVLHSRHEGIADCRCRVPLFGSAGHAAFCAPLIGAGYPANRPTRVVRASIFLFFFIFFFGGYQGNTRENGNPWEQAYKLTFFFFFFGGYQGNTRESGNPWEQAYKLTS